MADKLTAVGQKPISVLVDITNFVMLDLGRPLHVYDKDKLSGGLVARRAKPGEEVLALNGKSYALDETMTVIADATRADDIGGIMGGAHSGVSEDTRNIIIECAYFTPEHIARTGQKLMLSSDARQRFERGVDPAFLEAGLEIATWLVQQHCGGAASEMTRAGSPPIQQRTIAYHPARCLALGGVDVAAERQREILESLGFEIDPRSREGGSLSDDTEGSHQRGNTGDDWTITVPTWRRDVEGWQDIVEEVVRITGLDSVPSTPLPRAPGVAKPTASPAQMTERRARRAAAAHGFNEVVTWSFLSEKDAAHFGSGDWSLANPISEELKVMRPSLLPGLLGAAQRNADRGATSIRLFELGRRYIGNTEHPTIGFVMGGDKIQRGWQTGGASRFDAYDAKAAAAVLLEAAGAPVAKLMDFGDAGAHYHPGQSATLRLGPKNTLAAFGVLHPTIAKAFGLKGAWVAGEVFLDAIPVKGKSGHMRDAFTPPTLQPVLRDFAFVVDNALAAGDLLRAVKGADKALIVSARIFDVFTGATLGEGKKSLAIEVTLQPVNASLTEADLKALSDKVVAAAAKLGAELRH
jgi:phenylalanyl-tRNA synthetase beta chain